MPSASEEKIAAADSPEPPKIYIASCGVLCDVFWWARRNPSRQEPTESTIPSPVKTR